MKGDPRNNSEGGRTQGRSNQLPPTNGCILLARGVDFPCLFPTALSRFLRLQRALKKKLTGASTEEKREQGRGAGHEQFICYLSFLA